MSKIEPVGPLAMLKRLREPEVQTALGFLFTILMAMGTVLQTYQNDHVQQK